MTKPTHILAAAFLLMFTSQSVDASNLDALTRLLVPAYMAQSFASACIGQNPGFLSSLPEAPADLSAFATHVRNEVTADLKEQDALNVMFGAAAAARDVSLKEMQIIREDPRGTELERLQRWCEKSAKPFVLTIFSTHFAKHEEIEQRLKKAKSWEESPPPQTAKPSGEPP